MGDKTKIEWADASWNPIIAYDKMLVPEAQHRGWFCTKIGPECADCYAGRMNEWRGNGLAYTTTNLKRIRFDLTNLDQPLRWKRSRMIFVCSMTDLFHESLSFEMIDAVWDVMIKANWHVFQVLTKREDRLYEYLTKHRKEWVRGEWHALGRHIWLGVSAGLQETWDKRTKVLAKLEAAVRWVSVEPQLGDIKIAGPWLPDWVVGGGESGPKARITHPQHARHLRDQCDKLAVPFLWKQWGEWMPVKWVDPERKLDKTIKLLGEGGGDYIAMERVGKKRAGRMLDGRFHDGYPSMERRVVHTYC